MHSVFLELGPITIRWFGVMMVMALLSGIAALVIAGKREGRDVNYCLDLTSITIIMGLLGARLFYILSDLGYFLENPFEMLRIDKGGLVYYGGFLGAGLGILMFARKKGEKVLSVLDFSIIVVPLAHFFGRIGCFMNGCCFGKPYEGLFAVSFPRESHPWFAHLDAGWINATAEQSLSVIPVQLISAFFNLALGAILLFAYPRRKSNGRIIALYLIVYPPGRFLLEVMRGDNRMSFPGQSIFSQAQVMGFVLFLVGLVFLYISQHSKKDSA